VLFPDNPDAYTIEELEPIVEDSSYSVNDWVAAFFDKDWFPGCIESKCGTMLSIKFMSRKEFNQYVCIFYKLKLNVLNMFIVMSFIFLGFIGHQRMIRRISSQTQF
jgi:hypothetical protein